ncbi:MAG: hypothetical protein J3K34DRAFT_424001 [Monoraphidium minutum]|nr:MAG: hypothetical protein J3K34DRAFT_424001 [Monoraphidium minutum]
MAPARAAHACTASPSAVGARCVRAAPRLGRRAPGAARCAPCRTPTMHRRCCRRHCTRRRAATSAAAPGHRRPLAQLLSTQAHPFQPPTGSRLCPYKSKHNTGAPRPDLSLLYHPLVLKPVEPFPPSTPTSFLRRARTRRCVCSTSSMHARARKAPTRHAAPAWQRRVTVP